MQPERWPGSGTLTVSPLSHREPVIGPGGAIHTQHNHNGRGGAGASTVGFIDQGQIEYKPSYTHPGNAVPGYTYDFFLDEKPSSSRTQVETTLVCARCLDPLRVGGLSARAGIEGKMWGLRCGHILDGKCVAEIMRPPPGDMVGTKEVETVNACKVKGKGKAKAVHTPILLDRETNHRSCLHLHANLRVPIMKQGRYKMPELHARHRWCCPVGGCGRAHFSVQYQGETDWVMDTEDMGAVGIYV
jgi:hypothetical protein